MADITDIILNGTTYVLASGGISAVAQALLINILRNATYTTDQSTNITNLETELASGGGGSTSVAVINTLTNCTSNNSASSISVGSSYMATITANTGYDITSATVTMGGVDVTSSVYSAGVITIPNVTGTLVITVTAAEQAETGLAHYWDFTTGSLVDTIDGESTLSLGGAASIASGTGVTLGAANDHLMISFSSETHKKMKIKFGAMTNLTSGNANLIQISKTQTSTPAAALRYDNSNSIWENKGNTYQTAITAADAFANRELVLERSASASGTSIDVLFLDDVVISAYSGGFEYNYIGIGGVQGGGYYTCVIESIKVYTE